MDTTATTNTAALRLACRHVPPTLSLRYLDHLTHAALLDRLTDAELFIGHHGAAERLAWQAAALREATR